MITHGDDWTMLVTRVLAPNAGPWTLEGTNSYVIRNPGSHSTIVVDPGPDAVSHLRNITDLGSVELILLTHSHFDHSDAARSLAKYMNAPVRAVDPALCSGRALAHGELIHAAGTRLRVITTPGHTADSVCFVLPDDRALEAGTRFGSVLTGDTLLGRGSSIIDTGGSLADYLESLRCLEAMGPMRALPGHGPLIDHVSSVARDQIARRIRRLGDVEEALNDLGRAPELNDELIELVTARVYTQQYGIPQWAIQNMARIQIEFLLKRRPQSVLSVPSAKGPGATG